VMELHGKKGTLFIIGEVFPLDKDLLMGAECSSFGLRWITTIYCICNQRKKPPRI